MLNFLALALLASTSVTLSVGEGEVRYSRDIRPLLSNKCFVCHGPDVSTREADLRLDAFEFATKDLGGYAAIVPGDAEASELWYHITNEDPDEVMPPPASNKKPFTQQEQDVIRTWIEGGAKYEEHWAFVLPQDRFDGRGSDKNAIDYYVQAELLRSGVQPSPQAAPENLLRRLMLDLTGLPPTLDELGSFRTDFAENADVAWRQWVERVLTQEPYMSRFAERMATPWMDQARYADTSGIHMDAGRQMWLWRDWVLRAYRDNMPFDRFLTEQIAGDLIPNASLDQLVASGFNRNHIITDEGGAIDEEYLVEYSVDRVSTTGAVFLGLTTACARCHDHKFDPFTQEDFYKFFAFFNSIDEPGLYSQMPDPNRAFEPFIEVPSKAQNAERVALAKSLEDVRAELSDPSPEEAVAFASFLRELPGEIGMAWVNSEVTAASSDGGATLTTLEDGSVLASGTNPPTDVHHITLRTDASDLRLLQLDVLGHASFTNGAPGRAGNGNGVLTSIQVEAVSVDNPEEREVVEFDWAWADHAQDNDDYGIQRALDSRHNTGWAIAGHTDGGNRTALFLAKEPFGFDGGTDLEITLGYESIWGAHTFGRVRMSIAQLGEEGIARLPISQGYWYATGAFELPSAQDAYAAKFGPELHGSFDPIVPFETAGAGGQKWTYRKAHADGAVNKLSAGTNVHYVGKEVWSPDAREVEVSLGSDDGFVLFVNGTSVAQREVPRGVQADQDRATVSLNAGRNTLVFKIINTGGAAGFYFKALEPAPILAEGLVAGVLRRTADLADSSDEAKAVFKDIQHAWRLSHSPAYKGILERESGIVAAQSSLGKAIPRTMVMREREAPRMAFVLDRGEYDKADKNRPVEPGVPAFLAGFGAEHLPSDRRATRLDLAHWMTDPENPLVSRVAVNRIWQVLFGRGLVATSGDFGLQGSWPSHPELLDHLAVTFVEGGWDTRDLLRTILLSETYRQSSRGRTDTLVADPTGALLSTYPVRRLTGEAIRDGALFVSGLLVEEFGGPSVKPYQPSGLWREVAMNQSNTRTFELGTGGDLFRRSVYTYWKRAAPPPALLTFDAPTREGCEILRGSTNTPLQALALWNDEQFVEAARNLALRCLDNDNGADPVVLAAIFESCTGRKPDVQEAGLLAAALSDLKVRYRSAPEDAEALLSIGMTGQAEDPAVSRTDLAAWSMIASAILNLHATITQR